MSIHPSLIIDSNIILDVVQNDPIWVEWSLAKLEKYALTHSLIINPIIYAEVSVGFSKIEEVEFVIREGGFKLVEISKEAAFLAGKAFLNYRKAKGVKTSVLSDFFIGAQAAVTQTPILTRDVGRYKTYFPTVELIHPV